MLRSNSTRPSTSLRERSRLFSSKPIDETNSTPRNACLDRFEEEEEDAEEKLKLVVRTFQDELEGKQAALNERSEELLALKQELQQAQEEIERLRVATSRQNELELEVAKKELELQRYLLFDQIWEQSNSDSDKTDDEDMYKSNRRLASEITSSAQNESLLCGESTLSDGGTFKIDDNSYCTSDTLSNSRSSTLINHDEGNAETSSISERTSCNMPIEQIDDVGSDSSESNGVVSHRRQMNRKDEEQIGNQQNEQRREEGQSRPVKQGEEKCLIPQSQPHKILHLQERLEKEALVSQRNAVHRQLTEVHFIRALEKKETELVDLRQKHECLLQKIALGNARDTERSTIECRRDGAALACTNSETPHAQDMTVPSTAKSAFFVDRHVQKQLYPLEHKAAAEPLYQREESPQCHADVWEREPKQERETHISELEQCEENSETIQVLRTESEEEGVQPKHIVEDFQVRKTHEHNEKISEPMKKCEPFSSKHKSNNCASSKAVKTLGIVAFADENSPRAKTPMGAGKIDCTSRTMTSQSNEIARLQEKVYSQHEVIRRYEELLHRTRSVMRRRMACMKTAQG